MISTTTPVAILSSVGKTTADRLKRIGINIANDLLWNIPRTHEDISEIIPIDQLQPDVKATIKARVETIGVKQTRARRMKVAEAIVVDGSDQIKITWFNQPYVTQNIKSGDELYFAGTVKLNHLGQLQISNPTYEKISNDTTNTARIVPIYHLTAGLTQKQLRFLIKQVLPLATEVEDYISIDIQKKYKLVTLEKALNNIHFPDSLADFEKAQKRLKFDELFLTILTVQLAKQELLSTAAHKIKFQKDAVKDFVKNLPFTLTDDQKKVAWTLLQDMDSNIPTNRLIQGDVGSGKTVVAAMALLNTVVNNYQGAILAPTEILALQHFKTFQNILKDNTCVLLTRSYRLLQLPGEEAREITKKQAIELIAKEKQIIIIGTHALLQEAISFSDLGLIIVDEQHRFGVSQRQKLKDKTPDIIPHFVSMTATPIPRSLSLTLYGDLDISRINQKPQNRKNIITRIITPDTRNLEYDFIKKEIEKGNQIFVVCPLIEESDKLGVASATKVFTKLSQETFKDYQVGLVHGKLKKQKKEEVMNNFRNKKINVLVATAVIEVGVDIPDATIVLIEGADRFGLAQLHQFRGRVGRSEKQSYCLLASDNRAPHVVDRLKVLVKYNSGFEISEQDLKTRGPGDLYGYKQSGLEPLTIASLSDTDIMEQAKTAVTNLLEQDKELTDSEALRDKLKSRQPIHFE